MTKIEDIRVATIIEDDKIVINKGKNDFVEEYMEFLVYSDGNEIFDPITKKSLGVLENPKGVFKPIHIQDNMTILLSKLKRPTKFAASLMMFTDTGIDAERDLLKSIKVGDKVKIINQI